MCIWRGWVRQNTSVFVSVLLGWRHVSATVVHIVNFQRDLVVMRFVHIELITRINRITTGSRRKFTICTTTNNHTLYSFPLYTFLWPEDGPKWPKHVVNLTNRIQRQLCFDIPTPSLSTFCYYFGHKDVTEILFRFSFYSLALLIKPTALCLVMRWLRKELNYKGYPKLKWTHSSNDPCFSMRILTWYLTLSPFHSNR